MIDPKINVPRHRIPKLSAVCVKCGKGTKVLMSQAFSEGYHRRHLCRDIRCGYSFYTLTPYDHVAPPRSSPLPFHDRPMTEFEREQREQWWLELDPEPVTLRGNDPFLQRVADALNKEEDNRTTTDEYISTVFTMLKQKVAELDQGVMNE